MNDMIATTTRCNVYESTNGELHCVKHGIRAHDAQGHVDPPTPDAFERTADVARDAEARNYEAEILDDIASHDAYVRWMGRDARGSSVAGAMRSFELSRAGMRVRSVVVNGVALHAAGPDRYIEEASTLRMRNWPDVIWATVDGTLTPLTIDTPDRDREGEVVAVPYVTNDLTIVVLND